MPETYQCPFCGGEAAVGSPCPGCARKQKRKRPPVRKDAKPREQNEVHDGLDLLDDGFDYDEFVAREFGHVPHRKLGVKWYWWALGCAMLVVLALMVVTRLW